MLRTQIVFLSCDEEHTYITSARIYIYILDARYPYFIWLLISPFENLLKIKIFSYNI